MPLLSVFIIPFRLYHLGKDAAIAIRLSLPEPARAGARRLGGAADAWFTTRRAIRFSGFDRTDKMKAL